MTSRRKPAIAAALCVALLCSAIPLRASLAGHAPATPESSALGLGRLGGGVLTGVFRPLLLTYLWIRADGLLLRGRQDELLTVYRTIHDLYPDNASAREYLGWHLAFNLKHDAPNPDVAWAWAREGLDYLAASDKGRGTIARWFFSQAGQQPDNLRYAGPSWKAERVLRAHAADWYEHRYGKRLDRFEAALALTVGEKGLADLSATILVHLTFDEWIRDGYAPHGPAAVLALVERAKSHEDPQLGPMLRFGRTIAEDLRTEAAILKLIAKGKELPALVKLESYEVALALWTIAARENDESHAIARLAAAAEILQFLEDGYYEEELRNVRQWLLYRQTGSGVPPPLPFD